MDVKAVDAAKYVDAIVRAYAEAGDPGNAEHARAVGILKAWDGLATADNTALPILTSFVEVAGKRPPPSPTADQAPLFAAQKYKRALLTPVEVERDVQSRVVLQPIRE